MSRSCTLNDPDSIKIPREFSTLLLWGDTIHVAEVQFADPDISIDYDVDRHAAMTSRKRLLADAAAQGYLVGRRIPDGRRWHVVEADQPRTEVGLHPRRGR